MTRLGGIPEDFEAAYRGLDELVESIGSGEVSEDLIPEKADEYRRTHCRGSSTLAGAALRALSYELSSRGLQEGVASYPQELQALALVEAALEPAPATHQAGNETAEIVEAALPEQLREVLPNGRGFVMGELQMIFEPTPGNPPYAHMSVSHPRRYPTYEELRRAARAPGGPAPNLWMWLPKPEEEKSRQPNTVHLYVVPPEGLVG
jgi:hypothetical protein